MVSTEAPTISRFSAACALKSCFPSRKIYSRYVPDRFAERTNERGVTLTFTDETIDGLGVLRQTSIVSAKIDIFALMLFPYSDALPIFAAEHVVFSQLVRAAVVDFQPLPHRPDCQKRTLAALKPTFAAWSQFGVDAAVPGWCVDYFTSYATFAMDRSLEDLPALREAFSSYARCYAQLVSGESVDAGSRESAEMRAYKLHHIVHTPGRPMLERSFGSDWTEDFLRNGMYA